MLRNTMRRRSARECVWRSQPTRFSVTRQTDAMPRIPAKVEQGANALAQRDKVMQRLVREHGLPTGLGRRARTPHFAELARMICYQQLAGRAAAAIHGRFVALFDGPPTPEAVLALPME